MSKTFRCRIWVENCRRADLEGKTSDQLNKHYRLCAKHFDPAMVCKTVSTQIYFHKNIREKTNELICVVCISESIPDCT